MIYGFQSRFIIQHAHTANLILIKVAIQGGMENAHFW